MGSPDKTSPFNDDSSDWGESVYPTDLVKGQQGVPPHVSSWDEKLPPRTGLWDSGNRSEQQQQQQQGSDLTKKAAPSSPLRPSRIEGTGVSPRIAWTEQGDLQAGSCSSSLSSRGLNGDLAPKKAAMQAERTSGFPRSPYQGAKSGATSGASSLAASGPVRGSGPLPTDPQKQIISAEVQIAKLSGRAHSLEAEVESLKQLPQQLAAASFEVERLRALGERAERERAQLEAKLNAAQVGGSHSSFKKLPYVNVIGYTVSFCSSCLKRRLRRQWHGSNLRVPTRSSKWTLPLAKSPNSRSVCHMQPCTSQSLCSTPVLPGAN